MIVMDVGGETEVETGGELLSGEDEAESVREEVDVVISEESSCDSLVEGGFGGTEGSSGGMICAEAALQAFVARGSA